MLLRRAPLVPLLGLLAVWAAGHAGQTRAPADPALGPPPAAAATPPLRVVLDPGDPTRAAAVTFAVASGGPPAPAVEAAGRRAPCRVVAGRAVCPFRPPVAVRAIDAIRIAPGR